MVVRDRIELSTFRFSGGRSYQLSYLTWTCFQGKIVVRHPGGLARAVAEIAARGRSRALSRPRRIGRVRTEPPRCWLAGHLARQRRIESATAATPTRMVGSDAMRSRAAGRAAHECQWPNGYYRRAVAYSRRAVFVIISPKCANKSLSSSAVPEDWQILVNRGPPDHVFIYTR